MPHCRLGEGVHDVHDNNMLDDGSAFKLYQYVIQDPSSQLSVAMPAVSGSLFDFGIL